MTEVRGGDDFETDRPSVGLLFVHGIGQQERGQTLSQCEEAICQWLSSWLASSIVLDHEHTYHKVAPTTDPEAPAFGHIYLRDANSNECLSHLLFAESWWAECFEVPRYGDVARWGSTILPWSVLASFNERLRAILHQHLLVASQVAPTKWEQRYFAIRHVPEFLITTLLAGLVLPIASIIQIFLLAMIPFGKTRWLRWSVIRAQRFLSEVVGDTYALLQDEVSFNKMVFQVRKDLTWISERCSKVFILAHSQGSAVAHEALRTEGSCVKERSDYHLITFGAAVGRFLGMRILAESTERVFSAGSAYLVLTGALNVALLVAVARIGLSPINRLHPSAWYNELTFYVLTATFVLVLPSATAALFPISLKRVASQHQSRLVVPRATNHNWWNDFYASADPVPNGPLVEPSAPPHTKSHDEWVDIKSTQVRNRQNPFRDHTTYWNNPDGFVTRIIASFAPFAKGIRRLVELPLPVINGAEKARTHRLRSLNYIRLSLVFWAVVVCTTNVYAFHPHIQAYSDRRTPPFAWTVTVAAIFVVTFWLWSMWNRAQEKSFLRSHTASQHLIVDYGLSLCAFLLPGIATLIFRPRVRFELIAIVCCTFGCACLLAAVSYVLSDPAKRYGAFTGKDGELRRGSAVASCVGLVFALIAWTTWGSLVAGSDDLQGVIGRSMVIPFTWLAFLMSSIGFVKGRKVSKALALVGLSAVVPAFLTYPFRLASVIATLLVVVCTYVSMRGFDEAAQKLDL